MFRIDGSDALRSLKTVERRILDVARWQLGEAAKVARRNAEGTTLFKDRTGELRGTIDVIDRGTYWKRVIARARHGRFIEDGTKPHVIRPRNGTFLKFVVGGRTVFARKVNHPGTSRRPFMQNAANAGAQAMRVLFDEGIAKAIDNP